MQSGWVLCAPNCRGTRRRRLGRRLARLRVLEAAIFAALLLGAAVGRGEASPPETSGATNAPSLFRSPEDGWLDVSAFLDQKYGFIPIAMPITEPAVGYGGAGGLAFISKPLAAARAGFDRPNITFVGGMGTENGTWGAAIGDIRHWLDDRLQTVAGVVYASVNLDYYGLGNDPQLADDPLRYNLEPAGGLLQAKYRLGSSRFWAGLSYAYARTEVTFDAPPGTPGRPDVPSESNVGGLTPSFTLDSRDNIFTPTRGTYLEVSAGLFSEALGSDSGFQRAQLIAMQYVPLHPRLFLGLRAQVAASFGDEPFYLRPFIFMRGVPMMRYQGEELAQIEGEVRWQFWNRFSLVGFIGGGTVWNSFEGLDDSRSVVAGGAGFRYEMARKYGMHMGVDVAFGPDDPVFYIQFGSAWSRP